MNTEYFFNLFNDILTTNQNQDLEMLKTGSTGDSADLVSAQREENLKLKLNGRNQLFIRKVENARDKILSGEFGVCEDCGCHISPQRMMARPTAELCINCKEEQEKTEGQTIHAHKFIKEERLINTSAIEGNDMGRDPLNLRLNKIDAAYKNNVLDF